MLSYKQSGMDKDLWLLLRNHKNPREIQSFVNSLPFNFEGDGETYMPVQETLRSGKAHCFEGALVAAAALWIGGNMPLLMDLRTAKGDDDHVVALFRKGRFWGAISKTNHAVLRYREPIYRSIRELALSYFHEYFLANGEKTLRSYSDPFDLTKHGHHWLTSEEELHDLVEKLDRSPHTRILTPAQIRKLRKADRIEIMAIEIREYP